MEGRQHPGHLATVDRTRVLVRLPREERRRITQADRLRAMSDIELWEVARELYWRAEQFPSEIRMIVNDELRHRRMPELSVSTGGDLDYGSD